MLVISLKGQLNLAAARWLNSTSAATMHHTLRAAPVQHVLGRQLDGRLPRGQVFNAFDGALERALDFFAKAIAE